MNAILGKKIGMTQVFDEKGTATPVTVIEAGPCLVISTRTAAKDGYEAVQIGFGEIKDRAVNKPAKGHFKRHGVKARRVLREVRGASGVEVGQEVKVDIFQAGEKVDVIGVSKGKGFQGGMKRHRFHGGPNSHGGMAHRVPCSSGSTDAARTFKGTRKPGHMGAQQVTALGLQVVRVDAERNLLLVRGSVPGANDGLVMIRRSVKK